MGIFKRDKDPEKELARALAKCGVAGEATILEMSETGATRTESAVREFDFTLSFAPAGAPAPIVTHARQFMSDVALTGLAPHQPVSILYDSEHPHMVMVLQSPKHVFVHNPNQAFDGRPVVAVRAAGIPPDSQP